MEPLTAPLWEVIAKDSKALLKLGGFGALPHPCEVRPEVKSGHQNGAESCHFYQLIPP